LIEAGCGLAAAHEGGVIHRDVKPDNILVRSDGAVQIADFGVACELGAPQDRIPGVAGTPAYMAPEGFEGEADAATDQFAFAIMAFEILEKHRPFEIETQEEARRHALRPGRHAPWRRGVIPARIRGAIERGMALDPADRWPSMRALCAALEGCRDLTRASGRGRRYRPAPR
jgi:serine/threonine protein kinase